ncbi:MAG: beta-galactosidase [Bryobacteraceae bacterium]
MTLRRREFLGSLATSLAAGAKSPQAGELHQLALLPQDVGMGARNGSDKRFEAAYTLEIETLHVKWANPLPGGPIHLLAVPTVDEGRTIVELAQRVSLDLTTVSIDPNWDVNKWTMAFGTDYGARAEKGDLKLVYSYLERELTSAKHFDAVLLPLNHGWNKLTPASRDALARRVNEGCGLVLIRPDGELSPLSPVDMSTSGDSEFDEREPVARTESSPWHRTGDHYISRAIPVENFPFGDVQNFTYRVAPDATVLIRSDSGNPLLAVRQSEKGRVVAFGYRNQGISWQMPISARGHFVDVCWEYFYAMLVRAIIYAAAREPKSIPDFTGPKAVWRVRDQYNRVLQSGHGHAPQFTNFAAGRYFLERQLPEDWIVTAIETGQPEKIEALKAKPEVIAEGTDVEVRWQAGRRAHIELIDGFGRVLASAEGSGTVRVSVLRPLTHSGFVRATIGTTIQQIPVRFVAPSREWDDYEVILPWYGPKSYQPWIPALDEQFRRIGVSILADPDRNFKMMVSAHLPGFGIYWYRREAYLKRKADYLRTKDAKYLTREVTLESPAFEAGIRAQLETSVRPLAPLKPMACYLADESSLTFYADAFDVDWAPESLAGLRRWLREEYGDLDALNASWGTSFHEWDAILPMTTEQAQKHGNYAGWADHRAYMESEFVNAFAKAKNLVSEIDPKLRASISGTQVPTAHNGCNWYRIDQVIDYLQPYSDGCQDAMHYLFRPGLTITGFTGYGLVGDSAQHEQWRRLFYGHSGASIFWQYTLLNPDLTMSAQGRALAEAFGHLQSGIARVFMNSTVREDGVAIHFSTASIRGSWITDGKIVAGTGGSEGKTSANFAELAKRREIWVKELETNGVQFRFLATAQIEDGMLDRYRVLILPYSIATTDNEAKEIERFMARGGIVYGDEQTARMDGRCHWRTQPLWDERTKGFIRSGPRNVGMQHDFGGPHLVTVRDFGSSELFGILPEKPAAIRLPETKGVRYDLLRGGIASPEMESGPTKPVLIVTRKSRISKLSVDKNLKVTLRDESDQPVDLSVVRAEIIDPGGHLIRHYSSNLTVRDGAASLQIPFAINDAKGTWRVQVRDVISGLTAATSIVRA